MMQRNTTWLHLGHALLNRVRRTVQRLLGMSTLGVRALVLNEKQQVLLVEHTYLSGWHFPGGGVKPTETPIEALSREVLEETGILIHQPQFFGIYVNRIYGASDYPILYIVDQFTVGVKKPCGEIKQWGWFDLDNLPPGIQPQTRQRIKEYQRNLVPETRW